MRNRHLILGMFVRQKFWKRHPSPNKLCQGCERSAPLWHRGYGMGRHNVRTMNTIAFYLWQFECTEIPWWEPEAHCHVIHSPTSPHVSAFIMHSPMSQRSVHNSRKLKISHFFHGLHTHQKGHPLTMFGMIWIDVYDSMFQFPPISSKFAQSLKRCEATFHTRWLSHQILTGFLIHSLPFFKVSVTNRCTSVFQVMWNP